MSQYEKDFQAMVQYEFYGKSNDVIGLFSAERGTLTPRSPLIRRIWSDIKDQGPGHGSAVPRHDATYHPMRSLPGEIWERVEDRIYYAQVSNVFEHLVQTGESGDPAGLNRQGIRVPEILTYHLRNALVLASSTTRMESMGYVFAENYTSPERVNAALAEAVEDVFGIRDETERRKLMQQVVTGRENSLAGDLFRVSHMVERLGTDSYYSDGSERTNKQREVDFLKAMAQVALEPNVTPSPLFEVLKAKY